MTRCDSNSGALAAFGPRPSEEESCREQEKRKKADYKADLEAQIEAKRVEKIKSKTAIIEEEMKKDAEIRDYLARKRDRDLPIGAPASEINAQQVSVHLMRILNKVTTATESLYDIEWHLQTLLACVGFSSKAI